MMRFKNYALSVITGMAVILHITSISAIIESRPWMFIMYILTSAWIWAICKANKWFFCPN